ncbi:MAG: DNA-processing protein DprA [Actinomycetota bacterium]
MTTSRRTSQPAADLPAASRVIAPGEDEWPAQLDDLGPAEPPARLFLRGRRLRVVSPRAVAIVGSRNPTAAGLDAARTVARSLAEAGVTVISGLALGIDAAAHQAALDAGGYTVAVLGTGTDVCYPERNAPLQSAIAERGTLVSEHPDGTGSRPYHFPARNRIIAGLAAGVVIVEGTMRSGALITARHALDANRDVFAVPGSIRNPLAAAPNELIRTAGAALVTEVNHIFEELEPELVWSGPVQLGLGPRALGLDDFETRVLGFLDDTPVSPDRICRELGAQPGAVALALARLEIRGFAQKRTAGYRITTGGARALSPGA